MDSVRPGTRLPDRVTIHPEIARAIVDDLTDFIRREVVGVRNCVVGDIIEIIRYRLQLRLLQLFRSRVPEWLWSGATEVECEEYPPDSGYVKLIWPPALAHAFATALSQIKPPETDPREGWRVEGEEGLYENDP